MRRPALLALMLLYGLAFVACGRQSLAPADPGVNLGDPEVGGGAGVEAGPETPVPLPTATREGSPRLDATAAATLAFPPTATPEPAADSGQPSAVPAVATAVDDGQQTPVDGAATVEPSTTPAPPEPLPTATPEGERIHVVKAGENLYRIGLQYGLAWTVIAEYNGITDPNQIAAGQELRIPPAPTATPTAENGATTDRSSPTAAGSGAAIAERQPLTIVNQSSADPVGLTANGDHSPPAAVSGRLSAVVSVTPGDTLYGISQRYGVSWTQIAEANGLETPNQLYPGQVLKIPPDVPGPNPDFTHRVHRGDTLATLAQQYGMPLAMLAEANGLIPPYTIFPGQTLVIPSDK